ncbi:MAG TPA: iron-sulfur cluster repair protein YtfE [Burkholderiales bacterium]|nr:iron-sulfur cluster repair protein YtfE [Burkholderiales bacterium]
MSIYDLTIAQIARDIPGATRVFRHYDLDFCCRGGQSLRDAAKERGLDEHTIGDALEALITRPSSERDWRNAEPRELIQHILARYHAVHREQLPEMIRLAQRVEEVHGARADCPAGLTDLLREMQQELESHMMKEEQILFPMLSRGRGPVVCGPITVMMMEHEQHGASLDRMCALTNDITLPEGACNTWRALYGALAQFRDDLMDHIHLENNILFASATEPLHV